ncbi:hypothetical protein HIM_09062 [Hirsutella minnesotensis 3608]|uniref:Uncharacterized protein n=1 Tax=Hirsutella minnesotensis 3608 TaxID=1043627 RepID=A0A0F8A3B2_9HYPO|nr:hypothetical protein HIM_09062 [Hirsutella minnesotensis 3608]
MSGSSEEEDEYVSDNQSSDSSGHEWPPRPLSQNYFAPPQGADVRVLRLRALPLQQPDVPAVAAVGVPAGALPARAGHLLLPEPVVGAGHPGLPRHDAVLHLRGAGRLQHGDADAAAAQRRGCAGGRSGTRAPTPSWISRSPASARCSTARGASLGRRSTRRRDGIYPRGMVFGRRRLVLRMQRFFHHYCIARIHGVWRLYIHMFGKAIRGHTERHRSRRFGIALVELLDEVFAL